MKARPLTEEESGIIKGSLLSVQKLIHKADPNGAIGAAHGIPNSIQQLDALCGLLKDGRLLIITGLDELEDAIKEVVE